MCDIDEADISIHNESFLRQLMQELSLPFHLGVEEFIRVYVFLHLHYRRLMETSDYGVCNAPILFAQAAKVSHLRGGFSGSAWDKYTKSGVTSFDVNWVHLDMDMEGASRELADFISPYLEQKR